MEYEGKQMPQLEEAIKQIKMQLDKARNDLLKARARLESLEQQEEEIIQETRGLGVEPDQLQQKIAQLEEEIHSELEQAWGLLPLELRK
jgi:chromosome segregation ATPase